MKEDTKSLVDLLGGQENIKNINHCMTRLRLEVKNSSLVKKEYLNNLPLTKGIVINGENIQIVIGVKVKDVYKEITDSLREKSSIENLENKKIEKSSLAFFSEIFLPMIVWILMTGMLLIFNSIPIINKIHFIGQLYEILIDYFSVPLGYSIFKYFKRDSITGIAFGFIAINLGINHNLFLLIPSLLLLLKLEEFLERFIKEPFKILLVPVLSLLIMFFLGDFLLWNLGELTLESFIKISEDTLNWSYYPILAGIFGGIYAISVKHGLHHILLFLDLQLILSGVGTFFWPMVVISNISQGSVALGTSFKEWKAVVLAYIGITEPAMYGINLKEKKRFILAIILSSLGGYLCGIYRVKSMGIGPGGIPAVLIVNENIRINFILIVILVIVSGIILGALLKRLNFKLIKC